MTKLVIEVSKLKSILFILFIVGIAIGIIRWVEVFVGIAIMFYLAL
jgi:hypothetical protein